MEEGGATVSQKISQQPAQKFVPSEPEESISSPPIEEIAGPPIEGMVAEFSKEELSTFDPQDLLMDKIEEFAGLSVTENKGYQFILPIVGGTPLDINQKFMGVPGIERYMSIDAKTFAQITPKIDLFKVLYPTETSKGVEIPIAFNKTLTEDEKTQILQNRQSRGVGSGVISFDWELAGKNPAEAKTHIKATLKIFLKSIVELDKVRAKHEKYEVKYLDLIYRELKKNKDVYNPNYFLLKANVGWRASSSLHPLLKKAVEKCQTTMYLSLYKHELEFKDDGSAILTVNYIGYIASLLANLDLFDPERKNKPNVYGGPSLENYQSILKDLVKAGRLYITTVKRKEIKDSFGLVADIVYEVQSIEEKELLTTTAKELSSKSSDAKNDTLKKIRDLSVGATGYQLKWFYFGDLLDTILKYAYMDPSMRRTRFMLGPIVIEDNFGDLIALNLCDIPISLDMYQTWFQEKIINAKKDNLSLASFLQMVFDTLVKGALLSGRKRNRKKAIKVPTISFSQFSLAENGDETDPIFGEPEYVYIDNWGIKGQGWKPEKRKSWTEFDNKKIFKTSLYTEQPHYHYFFLYSSNEKVFARHFGGSMPERKDSEDGIYYFSTGRKNNIVRDIKFNKQDIPNLSEANIQRSGMKNTVLRGFYNATITMEGAPVFKPGMIIYVDGAAMAAGDTRSLNALSRRLGFGGYYVILKASHEITQGNFSTTLECSWLSFGDEPVHVKFLDEIVEPELEPIVGGQTTGGGGGAS
jgi:hypothetical protein